jgi:hypothetical protein
MVTLDPRDLLDLKVHLVLMVFQGKTGKRDRKVMWVLKGPVATLA